MHTTVLSQRTKKRPSYLRSSQEGRRRGANRQSTFPQVTGSLRCAPPPEGKIFRNLGKDLAKAAVVAQLRGAVRSDGAD